MKKLIALFATTAVASGSAMGAIALSGTASVSYDDNGTAAASKSYDADLSVVGTAGSTTVTIGADVDGASFATTSAVMATTIGPVTVSADLHDEVSLATTTTGGGQNYESTDTSISSSDPTACSKVKAVVDPLPEYTDAALLATNLLPA